MDIAYDVMFDSIEILVDEMESVTGIPWKYNSGITSGAYQHSKGRVIIGALELKLGAKSRCMSSVNYVSMHKQCFHEYRHWQQYNKFFTGIETDGLSGDLIKQMAIQCMISNAFPNYSNAYVVRANYLDMIMELDAEEYALVHVRDYLRDKGVLSNVDLESSMLHEINRRDDWWGTRPAISVDDAISDLHSRKLNYRHLSLQNIVVSNHLAYAPIYRRFVQNTENMDKYLSLPDDEQDSFLIDFICRCDVEISEQYPVLNDMFPVLLGAEKMKRLVFRKMHGLKDDNQYDVLSVHSKRVSDANLRLGDVGVDVGSPNDVSFLRPLPDIDCLDNGYDENQFGD